MVGAVSGATGARVWPLLKKFIQCIGCSKPSSVSGLILNGIMLYRLPPTVGSVFTTNGM